MKRRLIIAIDGPAGSGKSTVAKRLAKRLGLPYVDTGAMYRALTLKAINRALSLENSPSLVRLARETRIEFQNKKAGQQRVFLDGEDVTREIRTPELTKRVFYVAKNPGVRSQMVKRQRQVASHQGAVLEGRDIGTVVFPDADFKFYLDADFKIRALRRYKELKKQKVSVNLCQTENELKRRDLRDKRRKVAPLKKAGDAITVDTTQLTIPKVTDKLYSLITKNKF